VDGNKTWLQCTGDGGVAKGTAKLGVISSGLVSKELYTGDGGVAKGTVKLGVISSGLVSKELKFSYFALSWLPSYFALS
jgi:hypothetical protein